MKTLVSITKMSFIALAMVLVSCNKDDGDDAVAPIPTPSNPNNSSYITGKVDGADFSTIIFGTSTATCNRVNPGAEQMITILGGDLAANSITITLWNVTTTGEYTVNSETNSFLNYSPGSGGVAYATSADCPNATGRINVTYIDNTKVEGTFSFTGVDTENCGGGTKTVTEGSFRGTYPN